jgi:hypothetical protein
MKNHLQIKNNLINILAVLGITAFITVFFGFVMPKSPNPGKTKSQVISILKDSKPKSIGVFPDSITVSLDNAWHGNEPYEKVIYKFADNKLVSSRH